MNSEIVAHSTGALMQRSETAAGSNLAARRKSLRAAAIGNVLEWYDWTIYGMLSTYLAAAFFSSVDPTAALLSTLAVFAAGFVVRPVGGFVFGRLADRLGRKFTLMTTMILMGGTSAGMGLLPSHEKIGIWAAVGLFLLRSLQGLAHGGETGVSYVYIAEIAPKDRRGLWGSTIFVSVTVGIMLATGVAALLTGQLSPEQMNAWGWRIPFFFGALLTVYVMYLRSSAVETEAFHEVAENRDLIDRAPSIGVWGFAKLGVLIIALLAAMNVWYYTWVTFAPAIAISSYKMDPKSAYAASLAAQATTIVFLPVFGFISDKIGRRPMMMFYGVAIALLCVPIPAIINTEASSLYVAQVIGLTVAAIGLSIYPTLMAELVPAQVRGVGVGLITSLSVAIFGGTAPYLYAWTRSVDAQWLFQTYIIVLALCTSIAAFCMKETRGMSMRLN